MELFKEYSKRLFITVFGLFIFGVGNIFGIKAGSAGTNAWTTLALGLSDTFAFSFGVGNLLVSFVIVIFDLIGKGKLGFGSLLNMLLIPWFSDILLAVFSFVPELENPFLGAASTLLGQVLLSFATVIYMKGGLGCGPRDTMMIIVGLKLPKLPIGAVKFIIECTALAAGILMGAPFGLGTVLVMLLQAAIFQFVCRICGCEPREAKHEDFADTLY